MVRARKQAEKPVRVIFSPKRKEFVREFRQQAQEHPEQFGTPNTSRWRRHLLRYMQEKDERVEQLHLAKWIQNYQWITTLEPVMEECEMPHLSPPTAGPSNNKSKTTRPRRNTRGQFTPTPTPSPPTLTDADGNNVDSRSARVEPPVPTASGSAFVRCDVASPVAGINIDSSGPRKQLFQTTQKPSGDVHKSLKQSAIPRPVSVVSGAAADSDAEKQANSRTQAGPPKPISQPKTYAPCPGPVADTRRSGIPIAQNVAVRPATPPQINYIEVSAPNTSLEFIAETTSPYECGTDPNPGLINVRIVSTCSLANTPRPATASVQRNVDGHRDANAPEPRDVKPDIKMDTECEECVAGCCSDILDEIDKGIPEGQQPADQPEASGSNTPSSSTAEEPNPQPSHARHQHRCYHTRNISGIPKFSQRSRTASSSYCRCYCFTRFLSCVRKNKPRASSEQTEKQAQFIEAFYHLNGLFKLGFSSLQNEFKHKKAQEPLKILLLHCMRQNLRMYGVNYKPNDDDSHVEEIDLTAEED